MKKGTSGQNVNRWFSFCSSQPEFMKIQKIVSNNVQEAGKVVNKQKPSMVCILVFSATVWHLRNVG